MIARSRAYDRVKRTLDLVIAALAMVTLAPVMLVAAAIVAGTLGHPVLFRQVRPARHGRPFELVKFRTMRAVDPSRADVTDSDRLTRVGRFLRATSLDELPSLYNVVRGQMSLVGPRPLLVDYMPLYTPEQARRHEVRPGITGLAQVRGRNALSWEEKFAYDVRYVDNRSLGLDLRILAETVGVTLARKGVSADGHATAPAFTASPVAMQPGPATGLVRIDHVTA
jgi:lipopolysaccharide/colanic/teichoic acid biosynthesis glycosyltransferase